MKKTLISVMAAMLFGSFARAQPAAKSGGATEKEAADSAMIFFHLGLSDIDLDFENNRAELSKVMKTLEKAAKEGKVEKVSIRATASPDGSYEFNAKLSQNRANAIMDYITERCPIPQHKAEAIGGGIAWGWLRNWAEKSDYEYKNDIIRIIDEEPETKTLPNGKIQAHRKECIRALAKGKVYNYLMDNVFPQMRSGAALYLFLFPVPEDQMPQYLAEQEAKKAATTIGDGAVSAAKIQKEELVVEQVAEAQVQGSNFYMGIKSNLLYDALAIPNLGVEFNLGNGWALSAMYNNSWWNTKGAHDWWRLMGGHLEFRKYFGVLAQAKPMQGHHFGIYGDAMRYDFMFSGKLNGADITSLPEKVLGKDAEYAFLLPFTKGVGRLSDFSYGGGISYGYSLPISKRLNLDFEIAIGCIFGKGYDYTINRDKGQVSSENPVTSNLSSDCNTEQWYYKTTQDPKNIWYVGPTRLGVTLVYLIGNRNYNLK